MAIRVCLRELFIVRHRDIGCPARMTEGKQQRLHRAALTGLLSGVASKCASQYFRAGEAQIGRQRVEKTPLVDGHVDLERLPDSGCRLTWFFH